MSYNPNRDFLLEVRKNNIPGHEIIGFIARRETVTTAYRTLWGSGLADMTFPTAAEQWEIVSDSANDTAAGTGARVVAITSLDANFNIQVQLVTLNGTSDVTIPGTHIRPRIAFVTDSGSNNVNVGKLTISTFGGGGVDRAIIPAGLGVSKDGHYTTPAGKTAFVLQYIPFFPKNEDGNIRIQIRPNLFSNTSFIIGADLPFYQNGAVIPVGGTFNLSQKDDLILKAITSNVNVTVALEMDILEVDNQFLNQGNGTPLPVSSSA